LGKKRGETTKTEKDTKNRKEFLVIKKERDTKRPGWSLCVYRDEKEDRGRSTIENLSGNGVL
jgi:hypothetical protein